MKVKLFRKTNFHRRGRHMVEIAVLVIGIIDDQRVFRDVVGTCATKGEIDGSRRCAAQHGAEIVAQTAGVVALAADVSPLSR